MYIQFCSAWRWRAKVKTSRLLRPTKVCAFAFSGGRKGNSKKGRARNPRHETLNDHETMTPSTTTHELTIKTDHPYESFFNNDIGSKFGVGHDPAVLGAHYLLLGSRDEVHMGFELNASLQAGLTLTDWLAGMACLSDKRAMRSSLLSSNLRRSNLFVMSVSCVFFWA